MLWKGKEEMAERFQKYLAVQVHDEIEFLKSIGQDTVTLNDELRSGVEENEKKHTGH